MRAPEPYDFVTFRVGPEGARRPGIEVHQEVQKQRESSMPSGASFRARLARIPAVRLLGIVAAVTAASLILVYIEGERAERLERTERLSRQLIRQTDLSLRRIPLLSGDEMRVLRSFLNKEHVARAQALGVSAVRDRDQAQVLADEAQLVRLDDTPYYHVQSFDYSVPYVTRSTARLLEIIGRRFHKALEERGLPPYRYVITSAMRTESDQERLQRRNVNAATVSSHLFGTTVDLHYGVFALGELPPLAPDTARVDEDLLQHEVEAAFRRLSDTYRSRLKAILGRVLLDLQREGMLLAIYERRQPVYHITLGRRIADDEYERHVEQSGGATAGSREITPARPDV